MKSLILFSVVQMAFLGFAHAGSSTLSKGTYEVKFANTTDLILNITPNAAFVICEGDERSIITRDVSTERVFDKEEFKNASMKQILPHQEAVVSLTLPRDLKQSTKSNQLLFKKNKTCHTLVSYKYSLVHPVFNNALERALEVRVGEIDDKESIVIKNDGLPTSINLAINEMPSGSCDVKFLAADNVKSQLNHQINGYLECDWALIK